MKMMYYCPKCHNVVASNDDLCGTVCFQCGEREFLPMMISEKEYDDLSKNGILTQFFDDLWGMTAKRLLLASLNNPGEDLYYNQITHEFVCESGNKLVVNNSEALSWKPFLSDSHKLGKCGELYAQCLLESIGYEVFNSLVDDHGIDLFAKKSGSEDLLIQVKTVKEGNYTFIEKSKFNQSENFVVFYIRVDKDGVPSAFVYPGKVWPKESECEISYSYDGRFTFHPYVGEGQVSKAEYGISGAKKYYSSGDEFCIDTDDLFICNAEKFSNIIK